MVAIHLTGHITREGKLELQLPPKLTPGEVRVIIEPIDAHEEDNTLSADEEHTDFLDFTPKSGVVAMLGEHDIREWVALDMIDPVTSLEDIPQQRWNTRWERDEP